MLVSRKRLAAALGLAVVASGLLLPSAPASANPAGTGLVINEVYGAGGNSGAVRNADFIELYNPTAAPISLNGMYLHYRSASGSYGALTPLPGADTVQAHSTYLVQASAAGANGSALPTPDYVASPALNLAAAGGQTFLTTSSTQLAVSGNVAGTAGIIDMIGALGATTFEGAVSTVAGTALKSIGRASGADSDSNAADISQGDPTPTNSSNNATPLALAAIANKTGSVGKAITGFSAAASGGTTPYTYSATGLPDGVTIDPASGAVSGTPTAACACTPTVKVTDSASAEKTQSFTFTVSAFSVNNPGSKSYIKDEPITPFAITATGGEPPYTYSLAPGSTLPAGLTLDEFSGQISGTPTTAQPPTDVTVVVTASDADNTTATATFSIAVNAVLPIAELQGTGARSTYAPATGTGQGSTVVTTQGVITAIYNKGFSAAGAATCGFCGFYLQTGGTGGPIDTTAGSDAIFVYGFSSFTGAGLSVGDSVRVSGKVSEFSGTGDTESLTELNLVGAVTPVASLGTVTPLTELPATYADREAHEGELFAPTDLVITDNYNFESYGELGLATGGTPLVQPTETCLAGDTACITAAQKDIKDRGYFFEDGTGTNFLANGGFYQPSKSPNSDVPLPFIDKDHSARVGASLTFPLGAGGVLDYRNKKWYLQPQRAVSSTHGGDPDLGTDVVTIADTRVDNAAPVNVGGDLKIATYNVENYFSLTGKAFAAANPYYTCSWDFDRNDNETLTYGCTSPQAIPDQWDPVTHAPTHYASGSVSAPRGAARQVDLDRQTAKIVKAINGLGADVVSLEELGNPNKLRMGVTNGPLDPDTTKADSGLGTPIAWRDESIKYLVDHLNEDAGAGTWAFVASPEESTDATSVPGMCSKVQPNGQPVAGPAETAGTCSWASGQDVIRSGFLYKRATVVPVGQADLDLPGSSAPTPSPFDNAREPLAQFFKPVGHPNSDGFAVIVSHFKSKGDSDPSATGGNANSPLVGAFNAARVEQSKELLRFADEFAAKWDTEKVFLVGDFNSYTGEDPVQTVLNDPLNTLGFGLVTSDDPDDLTYVYTATVDGIGYGGAGSLDHVFASSAARGAITGTDVWEINSNEPGVYNYSRYNTNKTDFWDGTVPFGGSDHNPEIIGIDVSGAPSVKDIQIIGSNDFHGRLLGSSSDGGAAQLAGAVKSLKSTWGPDNSIFVAAGDLIGASTFESFVQQDKPTLEALNAAGLEVSAVGNHEFDQGYADLLDRVMKPYDATTNPYGAVGGLNWQYIGSNVVWDHDPDGSGPVKSGDPIVLPTWTKDFGDGIKVGFVGAVTEDLMSLVNPAKMNGVKVDPIAAAVNSYATSLKGDGVDLVVLLVHEGAPSTDCTTMDQGDSAFAKLLGDINPDIDAVISGHTHLEYSCSFPVPEWSAKPITARPVVSAGQYGVALDQLVYSFDTATGKPIDVVSNNVGVKGPGSTLFSYPEDPAVKQIVDDAVAAAAAPGARVLGKIGGAFRRARLAGGVTENRGGESTLGNLVAEIQRWATPTSAGIKPAQIAFMNPGGLRDDLNGAGDTFPKDVTYKAAAAVQPFANTLVNVDMTGAQIRQVLEQQWQRDAAGNVPSRPFLRLGTSKGLTYTYYVTDDPDHAGAKLGHVTGMWLDGVPIQDATSYSVTMNSFLASGGDNFRAFALGADKRDTGVTDLQAQVDYMAAKASAAPLAVDFAQHAVGITFPAGAPATYGPGDDVRFDVSSWAMTAPGDVQDTDLQIKLAGTVLGTVPVDNTVGANPNDEAGTASVDVVLPSSLVNGKATLELVGATTGTKIPVVLQVAGGLEEVQILATNDFHGRIQNDAGSAAAGAAVLAGAVEQLRAANPNTVFAAAGDLIGASTFESFIQNDKPTIDALNEAGLEVSAVGNHELDKGYDDLMNRVMAAESGSNPDGGAHWQYIAANLKMKATGDPAVPATFMKTMSGVDVGFVGAVTEDLPSLVSPDGIKDLEVTDIVDSVNDAADDLVADGADIVVMLVHEGSPSTTCATMTDPSTTWGHIVTGVNDNVDAIVSGHTHLEYNCSFPVAGWSGRPVTERPVVSAGQYGANLNQLVYTVNPATGNVQSESQAILKLKSCTNSTACTNYPADPATTTIVADAVTASAPLGAQVLGTLEGAFARAKFAAGGENRGGESTLGNLVAEVQRAETPDTVGAADIAFMNPGGLRKDMTGTVVGGARQLTYKQAADVQPFANTLVNMDLTGAQIKTVLEQQWQRTTAGAVPTRAFLRLGTSKGFTYTYTQRDDPANPGAKLGEVTGMWLNGVPIDPTATYSVTVNSFLASGGDNFRELANGAHKQDTGKTDLQAMVDYAAAYAADDADVPVDRTQHAVDVTFPGGAPASYQAGAHVVFALASLSMTDPGDVRDTQVEVRLGGALLGTATVATSVSSSPDNSANSNDDAGTASVDVAIPAATAAGPHTLVVRGVTTGTEVKVPIVVVAAPPNPPASVDTTTSASAPAMTYGTDGTINVTVTPATASGAVSVSEAGVTVGSGSVSNGAGTVTLAGTALEPGDHTLTVRYAGNATHNPSQGSVTVVVAKAATTLSASAPAVDYGTPATVAISATPVSAAGAVTVAEGATTLASGTLANGSGSVSLGAALEPGSHALTVRYAGDTRHREATATVTIEVRKVASTITAGATPSRVVVESGDAVLGVSITAGGTDASGTVTALVNGDRIASGTVRDGQATLRVGPFGTVGTKSIEVRYSGDDHVTGSATTATVEVVKATPTVTVDHRPESVTAGRTHVRLAVKVKARGFTPAGAVTVTLPNGETVTGQLRDGKVSVLLPVFGSPGTKVVTVTFEGNAKAEAVTVEHQIRVRRK